MSARIRLQRLVLIAVAIALATVALGWLGVVLASVVFAAIDRGRPSAPSETAIAAAIGWAGLLLLATGSSLPAAAHTLGGAMGLPGIALVITTIVFPALVAWSSAAIAQFVAVSLARP
jgi:hypothetical protein